MDKQLKFHINIETNGVNKIHDMTVESKEFEGAVRDAVTAANDLTHELDDMGRATLTFNNVRMAIDSLNGAIADMSESYNSFDTAMRSVNTMAGKSGDEYATLTDEVRELANVVPMAREELANGLYQVISNGVPEDNWISFLEQSSKAAVGGIADLGETVTVTSTIIKNYGLEWSEAGEIQDKIQQTAKNGVTSFEQLAAALPRVTGQAATLGVSIDELLGSFATLTGVSGNTAEVSTQLAAIFTALIKPSSEAAKMATEMGIQFDAAAIQAAGGMEMFISQLSDDVKAYAQTSGTLEQEIYGKLFGSAESLRALTALTGELSSKYNENVSAMADSTGTIDAAFAEMASSGEAAMQLLHNKFASMKDVLGSVASRMQPWVSAIANIGYGINGIVMLANATKTAAKMAEGFYAVHKRGAVLMQMAAINDKMTAAARLILTRATGSATVSTGALTVATLALYAAMTCGITLAVTALASAISAMGDSAETEADKVDMLSESTDEYKRAASEVQAEMKMEISELRSLIAAHGDATKMIEELNSKYGEHFGQCKTAEEWYQKLTKCSKDYALQVGYEAQARVLANQMAQKELERAAVREQMDAMNREGTSTVTEHRVEIFGGHTYTTELTDEYKALQKQWEALSGEASQLEAQFDKVQQKAGEAGAAIQAATTAGSTEAVSWQRMSYEDLGKAIDEKTEAVKRAINVDDAAAKKGSAELAQMIKLHDQLGEKYGLKKTTTQTDAPNKSKSATPTAASGSYADLTQSLEQYKKMLEATAPEETENIARLQKKIAELERERDAVRGLIEVSETPPQPADVSQLETIDKLDKAIEYYRQKQRTQTAEEVGDTQTTINALTAKRDAIVNLADVPELQTLSAQLDGLEGRELSLKMQLLGAENVTEQLAKIDALLADTSGAVSEDMKASLGSLRKLFVGFGNSVGTTDKKISNIQTGLNGTASIMGSLGTVTGGAAQQWLDYGANVVSAVATAIPPIYQLITTKKAEATANTEAAATGAAASVASIPYVGPILAVAAVASVLAALVSLPKFANGGIAYGPTLGLFGEYAGASTNPEVVAPLNKLKALIEPNGDGYGVKKVEFEIKGRRLRGVLAREERLHR